MKVTCPICEKTVVWGTESPFRPFCSKQCQLIDLGEWASEDRTIAQSDTQQQLPDEEEIEAMLAKQEGSFFKH